MAVREDNQSDKSLIVHSLKVLHGISGGGLDTLRTDVDALAKGQASMAEATRDYWSALASDGVIDAGEKKVLYKEWKLLVQEYADLVKSAEDEHRMASASAPLLAYRQAYVDLYGRVITKLRLFDDMGSATRIPDRAAFIAAYGAYYEARDALRDAIRDGEDARVRAYAEELAQAAQAEIRRVSLGGMAEAGVDYARYGTGLEQRLTQIVEAGSNAAFFGLSVGIPYFLTVGGYGTWHDLLAEKKDAAGLEYLAAVYEKVQTTGGGTGKTPVYFYRMKVDATDTQVRSLKNILLGYDALRSVITLDADLVQVHGDTVFSSDTTVERSVKDYLGRSIAQLLQGSDGTDAGFDGTSIINGGFIKTDLIDVKRLVATQAFIDYLMGGDATFSGSVIAGPLVLTNVPPSDFVFASTSSEYIYDIHQRLVANGFSGTRYNFSGSVNGSEASVVEIQKSERDSLFSQKIVYEGKNTDSGTRYLYRYYYIYDKTTTVTLTFTYTSGSNVSFTGDYHQYRLVKDSMNKSLTKQTYGTDSSLPQVPSDYKSGTGLTFSASFFKDNATFRLINLPSSPPVNALKGTIYVENKHLMITGY